VRILVATDGSDDARAAAAWLGRLPLPAAEHDVTVLTAIPPMTAFAIDEKTRATVMAAARRLADDTAAGLRVGVARGEVVEDDARDAIVAAARDRGADLIVLGARGLGAAARLFLGSVSLAVARHAPCPVLVCKGPPHEPLVVTVALDGSEHARRALEWVTGNLALSPRTQLRLLGVVEPVRYPASAPRSVEPMLAGAVAAAEAERHAALEAEFADLARGLRARLPAIETIVTKGSPADAIVHDVERSSTDLVVLGSRGAGRVRRLLLGSVSEAVLTHAACAVLIVRPRAS
jgi:nucleotide-binding universal stress UspA family protein